MDANTFLNFISEFAYLLVTFGVFLTLVIIKGRQAVINTIIGLYLALLISLQFPYYGTLFGGLSSEALSIAKLVFFAVLTALMTMLCRRIMPDEFRENKFESLTKKIILALSATILVMIFSFQILPVTDFLTPGTPIQALFAPQEYFFWWLLLPLGVLFML